MAHARVVLGQQVPGEVAAQVAPHGVDVIGLVLGVVVLDEQARPLSVIVAGARLDWPGPPEAHLVESGVGDVGPGLVGDGGGRPIDVLAGAATRTATLQPVQPCVRDAARLPGSAATGSQREAMSAGALTAIRAIRRWSSCSASISSRQVLLPRQGAQPACGPSSTVAGSAPKKCGTPLT